jgi:hypothetical protein
MNPVQSVDASTETASPPAGAGWGSVGLVAAYALTIFLSAFLLFQVQPMIAKFILPWFGGTPGVWTACMLFFQVMLFGGYLYAHLTNTYLAPRAQAILHVILLALACVTLPVIPNEYWKPTGDEAPVRQIVLLLAATVGASFFVLSSTGPLLQGWFSRTHAGRSPYRLYALSNAGSLLALVTYPFVFDWLFTLRYQAFLWSWGFGMFAALCACCAVALASQHPGFLAARPANPDQASRATAPSLARRTSWFVLAMIPSVLLLAITNQVCLDMISVPFLWVLPLTLYLLSFILCFDGERWYPRRLVMPVTAVVLVIVYTLLRIGADVPISLQIPVFFSALFLCAMICHGELVRLKPDARHLTSFYLCISAGGAAGGLFVGIVAPLVFTSYLELPLGLFACATVMAAVLFTDKESKLYGGRPRWAWLILLAGLGTFGGALVQHVRQEASDVVAVDRNFYGVLRVRRNEIHRPQDARGVIQPFLTLSHGQVNHGMEFESPVLQQETTFCYGPKGAAGQLLTQRPHGRPLRVGVVGLGVGMLAAYARPGDDYRFYEIDPMMWQFARDYFHFLGDCNGHCQVLIGDGRLTLEHEKPQNFDVLALDAFSGDAMPVHILTVEAFEIYLRHLAPDGVIAVHISPRHFRLHPVVAAIADAHKLQSVEVFSVDAPHFDFGSVWVIVGRNLKPWNIPRILDEAIPKKNGRPIVSHPIEHRRVLWTDDHNSLFDVLW